MHHRLLLGLACFAIVFGACRDENQPPAGIDAGATDLAVADTAPDAPDGPAADVEIADAAFDLAPDAGVEAGSADVAPDATIPPDVGPTCGPGAPRTQLCLSYCDGIGRFCGGASTQFRNGDECRAACNAPTWACGKPGDLTGNSLFCRLSHMALAGVGAAATECPNAGPSSAACQ